MAGAGLLAKILECLPDFRVDFLLGACRCRKTEGKQQYGKD
jgi:hypothetical protein